MKGDLLHIGIAALGHLRSATPPACPSGPRNVAHWDRPNLRDSEMTFL